MTPIEVGLAVVVVVLTVAVVSLAILLTRSRQAVPADPRLEDVTAKVVALEERTRHLPQVAQDLQILKERTEQLPTKIETVTGHTATLPSATKKLEGVDTKLEPLPQFVTDTTARLRGLEEATRQVPETATKVATIEQRLGSLSKIESGLEDLRGVFRSTTGRGQIGEDAVRSVLGHFPDDSWIEKLSLPTGVADFAVRMPNGLLLAIDSKTGGAENVGDLLKAVEALERARDSGDDDAVKGCEEAVERARELINNRVRKAARDIEKYVVPGKTTPFVVQALPDAVFDALDASTRQESSEVVPVPYSLLHSMISAVRRMQAHGEVDIARLSSAILKVRESKVRIEETVKNSVERAATMAQNAASAIRNELVAIEAALLLAEVRSVEEPKATVPGEAQS